MAHKHLRLQQHTPILQVSYITRYVFSMHWYIDFAEMYITWYIHHMAQIVLEMAFCL